MKLWVTRHGQTNLNQKKLMQGLSDEPLNEIGIRQAEEAHETVKNVRFDAVYASPLKRAVTTAAIIAGIPESEVIRDPRIIEVDFGRYEKRSYYRLGLKMSLYWACPELFPRPASVESIASMTARAENFLLEISGKNHENVLIVCHGGIIRALCGILEHRPRKIRWRPKPKNCEIRTYDVTDGI